MVDLSFYTVWFLYACSLGWVLYRYRSEPLYDPRILFTLATSLWLLIIHGYLTEFDGYLAAKPGFYSQDIRFLAAIALGMAWIGYLFFILGASIGTRFAMRSPTAAIRDRSLLTYICLVFIAIATLNFMANVMLISGGNVVRYLSEIAIRPYQIADNMGITASGYLFGFIGVQVLAFLVGRRDASKRVLLGLVALVLIVTVIRFSQARIFQTLVLVCGSYVSFVMGKALREGRHTPWLGHFHYLLAVAALGVGIYFLRLASSLRHIGVEINWQTVVDFSDKILHFALQRGNVPNFPVVFTIVDKMPTEESFLLGKTLFNWAIFIVPKSILKGDYLISLWVKRTWYLDVEGGGLPPTAIGEWYANFGFAGVVVGMFVVGLAVGSLYKIAVSSESPYLAVLWANVAFGFVVIYPKTDLAQIPVYTIFMLLCLWLLMTALQSGTRSHMDLMCRDRSLPEAR
jgi:oligosaccharide repeat unit polymerase